MEHVGPNLSTAEDIMNKQENDDDSDDEQTPAARFVAASQYDPAGVCGSQAHPLVKFADIR